MVDRKSHILPENEPDKETEILPSVDYLLCFGSFNPLTLGHVYLWRTGLTQVDVGKQLLIIPSADRHVWGKKIIPYRFRKQFVKKTLESLAPEGIFEKAQVSSVDYILSRNNASYVTTVASLGVLKEMYGDENSYGILMGADAILSFHKWDAYRTILQEAVIYVAPRQEYENGEMIEKSLPKELLPFVGTRIFFLDVPKSAHEKYISATFAREELQWEGTTQVVPHAVLSMILEQDLYETQTKKRAH